MNHVLTVYKMRGETPLQALDRLRVEKPELVAEKLSYAGRLDPLAEGLMLVLVGEANKEREKYLGLDKAYETEILLGISTDTGDVLGIINKIANSEIVKKEIQNAISSFPKEYEQKYPAYSSKTVDGRQLHEISRAGEDVEKPSHIVKIENIEILNIRKIGAEEILKYAFGSVDLVKGDFRQGEIKEKWNSEIIKYQNNEFILTKVELSVSSGFYIRQFAEDLGEMLGVPALAYSIKRTKVGGMEI